MANYRYRIVTPDGKTKTGTIPAGDRASAIELLRSGGNTVVSLNEASGLEKNISLPSFRKGISHREMSVFCRQFVTLSGSGVSIVRALEMLEEQSENPMFKEALRDVRISVEKGATLAESMRRQNKVFPPMFTALVGAGEEAGRLEVAFERMAIHYEKSEKMRGIVKKAMVYPIILALVALAVVVIMLTRIVPMYAQMFDQMGTEMPGATKALVAFSDFFTRFWWVLALVIIGIIVAYRSYAASPSGKIRVDRIKLKLPVLGKLNRSTVCAQFSRNLSTLLGSGMPIMRALTITADTLSNELYKQSLKSAEEQVTRGSRLADPIADSGLYPMMIVNMIRVGEETGTVDTMLEKAADYYEEELTAATESAAAALEPLIIIVMALIVVGIIAAVFAPMISLYTNIDAL